MMESIKKMPKSDDRFYLLKFNRRPCFYGDIGSILKIRGIVVAGEATSAILMLPDISGFDLNNIPAYTLTLEEWSDFIHRSDDPEILIGPSKIFQRKLRYEISGAVQQKVWSADSFTCVYCHRRMGEVQLSVDHFIPLENGGKNDPSNYVSACRKCNKSKGGNDPIVWCAENGIDPEPIFERLKKREW
jgi:hypothetical protein